jgi:hypothetical protein
MNRVRVAVRAGMLAGLGLGAVGMALAGGGASAASSSAKAAFAGTNWHSVSYPGTSNTAACGIYPLTAGQVTYERVPSGKSEALVLLTCRASSNPFAMLEAFTPGTTRGHPHYVQTLLNVTTNPWIAGRFSATATSVSMDVAGYGSQTVTSPNVFRILHWTWRGGRFVSGTATHISQKTYSASLHVG